MRREVSRRRICSTGRRQRFRSQRHSGAARGCADGEDRRGRRPGRETGRAYSSAPRSMRPIRRRPDGAQTTSRRSMRREHRASAARARAGGLQTREGQPSSGGSRSESRPRACAGSRRRCEAPDSTARWRRVWSRSSPGPPAIAAVERSRSPSHSKRSRPDRLGYRRRQSLRGAPTREARAEVSLGQRIGGRRFRTQTKVAAALAGCPSDSGRIRLDVGGLPMQTGCLPCCHFS